MAELTPTQESLRAALAAGDPERVAALIEAGADIQYQLEGGYDALLDAVYGRDVLQQWQHGQLGRLRKSLRGFLVYWS